MKAAGMKDSDAATMRFSAWPKSCERPWAAAAGRVLADPMCGSGTFLIEAALMAGNVAPGLFRQRWPFEAWPDFEPGAWRRCLSDARDAQRSLSWQGTLLGNDIHPGALSLAARQVLCQGFSRDCLRMVCQIMTRKHHIVCTACPMECHILEKICWSSASCKEATMPTWLRRQGTLHGRTCLRGLQTGLVEASSKACRKWLHLMNSPAALLGCAEMWRTRAWGRW